MIRNFSDHARVDLALAFLIVLLAGALLFYLGSTLSVKA